MIASTNQHLLTVEKVKAKQREGQEVRNSKGRLQRTKDGDGEDESHNDGTQLQIKNDDVLDQLLDRLTLDDNGVCTHGCPKSAARRGIGSVQRLSLHSQ